VSGRLKIDRDDTLSDGSARDSATRRSRPRVETRPIDAGRASLETEPDDRVPRCGREAPPFTAGEDVTYVERYYQSQDYVRLYAFDLHRH